MKVRFTAINLFIALKAYSWPISLTFLPSGSIQNRWLTNFTFFPNELCPCINVLQYFCLHWQRKCFSRTISVTDRVPLCRLLTNAFY